MPFNAFTSRTRAFGQGVYMYIDPQTEALMFDVHVFVRGGGAKPN
jgi:hypothetical protein